AAPDSGKYQPLVRAGLKRAKSEGKRLGRPPLAPALVERIREALNKPGRTEGVRRIAARFGVDPSTVQRISRPFDVSVGVAASNGEEHEKNSDDDPNIGAEH